MHPDDTVGTAIQLEIGAKQRISKRDDDFAIHFGFGAVDRMGGAQGLILLVQRDLGTEGGADVAQLLFDGGAKVADDEGDALDVALVHPRQVLAQALDNGLACNGEQWLGVG